MRGAAAQRGMSLAEVLVAMTILALTITTALVLYDDTRRAIKRGENRIDQQQVVRIAFDWIASDLRMAGFNHNPDGEPGRPDEQIEAAYDTAIVVRADLDAQDAVDSIDPEALLAGGAFDTVSTGNDEIVAYVLAKPDGSSTDTLTFHADVATEPRDGIVEQVDIDNVALTHDDPPYTLYRIVLNNDVGTYGTAGFAVRTPLAENVRSLSFRYVDKAGLPLNATFDLTTAADDIGGDETPLAIDRRRSIRQVRVAIVGQTRDPDRNHADDNEDETDREDTATGAPADPEYRRFRLGGDVVPRNMGMHGLPDLFTAAAPPSTPGAPNAAPGHCRGLYVQWTPNPPQDDVEYYKLLWGTAPGAPTDQFATGSPSLYVPDLNDATDYWLSVQAVDRGGNPSALSAETYARTNEATQPSQPQNLSATQGANEEVQLGWDAITTNDDPVPGDPASPTIRELAGYKVYRTTNSSASVGESDRIDGGPGDPPQGTTTFVDTTMVHCQDYWYTVKAEDLCGVRSAAPAKVLGRSFSTVKPVVPVNVAAHYYAADKVKVSWQSVTENEDGDTIYIDTYRIYRTALMPAASTPSAGDFAFLTEVVLDPWDTRQYLDPIVVPAGQTVWYKVSAVDRCPNESDLSAMVQPQCSFVGDFWIDEPGDGDTVGPGAYLDLRATPWTGPYERLTLEFENLGNGDLYNTSIEDTEDEYPWPNRWVYNDWSWITSYTDPYRITATLYRQPNCSVQRSITVFPAP